MDNTLKITGAMAHKFIKLGVIPENNAGKGSASFSSPVQVENYEPVAIDQKVANVAANVAKSIKLDAEDEDGDKLKYSLDCKQPLHGTLSGLNADTGDIEYTSNTGSADRFGFKVNDGITDSDCATVYIIGSLDKTALRVSMKGNADYIFTAEDFNPDVGSRNNMTAVKITVLGQAGSLKLNGVEITPNQRIARTDIEAGKLKFTPASNAGSKGYGTFQFKVFNGMSLSETTHTMTITK